MKKNKPESVGDILAKMVKKTPLGRKLDQARIWEVWPELATPSLAKHGRPQGVKEKTLIVEVDSTVWMNKYAYFKWDILKRVNRMAGRELISDIFLVLAPDDETPKRARK